jgi:hypothetical protein
MPSGADTLVRAAGFQDCDVVFFENGVDEAELPVSQEG